MAYSSLLDRLELRSQAKALPPERTVINVKAVDAAVWHRSRKAAMKSGETMGNWLSRACERQLEAEGEEKPTVDLKAAAELLKALGDVLMRSDLRQH